jgi:hypothetical protein
MLRYLTPFEQIVRLCGGLGNGPSSLGEGFL